MAVIRINNTLMASYLGLFSLLFLMCLGLGYATLNRFYPPDLNQISDTFFYYHIVQNGLSPIIEDVFGRSTRFLIPYLGHLLYLILPDIGSWNQLSVAILIVNSCFVAGTGCLIFYQSVKFSFDPLVGLIAAFLLLLNFQASNLFLVGLVEAGFCFFAFLFMILTVQQKYFWLPFVCVLGCFTKEVFLLFVGGYSTSLLLLRYLQERKVCLGLFTSLFLCCLTSLLCFFYLKYLSVGAFVNPFNHVAEMRSNIEVEGGIPPLFSKPLETIFQFSYVFLWLLPLALHSIKKIPAIFMAPAVGALIPFLLFGTLASISGNGYARITFSLMGPLFCIAAALALKSFLLLMPKARGNNSVVRVRKKDFRK